MYGLKPVPSKLNVVPSKLKPVPSTLKPVPFKLAHPTAFPQLRHMV